MKVGKNSWLQQADEILCSFETGVSPGTITQKELALHLGVSRQTVWRNKFISARIEKLQSGTADKLNTDSTDSTDSTDVRRPSSKERISTLQQSVERLKQENGNLTRRIVEIYTRLAEAGLNPLEFIGFQVLENLIPDRDEL